jgi:hypothetical protein
VLYQHMDFSAVLKIDRLNNDISAASLFASEFKSLYARAAAGAESERIDPTSSVQSQL